MQSHCSCSRLPSRAPSFRSRLTRQSLVSEHRMLAVAPRRVLSSINSRLCPAAGRMTSRARSRLDQFSRHLNTSKPFVELNTPFSAERITRVVDDKGNLVKQKPQPPPEKVEEIQPQVNKSVPKVSKTMSSQPPHPTLLIPGPIEFDDAVLQSMSHYR